MPLGSKRPQFELRASLTGTITWSCPICGHFNRSRIPPTVYRVRCSNAQCRRKFVYGLCFFEMPGGGRMRVPLDHIVPKESAMPFSRLREPLPLAELASERYRPMQRANEVVRNPSEPVVNSSDEMMRRMRRTIGSLDEEDDGGDAGPIDLEG